MRRLQMQTNSITFEQGCNKYLDNCRQRNLRQGTINHYKQSYTQFYKFFEPETPIEQITEKAYNSYVLYLRKTLNNDIGFVSEKCEERITVMQLIECSKRIFGANKFIFYAVADGVFALLAKYKQGINHMIFNPPKSPRLQLSLFGTQPFA